MPLLTERALFLVTELNRRGIRGRAAQLLLRKYSQTRIARQMDYYDHEIVGRARLARWAAPPWLAHRIRRDLPSPDGFVKASDAIYERMLLVPYRPSRNRSAS